MRILSTSAPQQSSTGQLTEAITKVLSVNQLSPEDDEKYKELYVSAANKKLFAQLGMFAAETSSRLQIAFNFLNTLVRQAAEMEDLLDTEPEQFYATCRKYLGERLAHVNSIAASPSSDILGLLAQNLQYPSGLVVKDSSRYPGGSDIINSGIPSSASDLAASGNFTFMRNQPEAVIDSKNDEVFAERNIRIYSAEIAQSAIRAAGQLYEAIMGAKRPVGRGMFSPDTKVIPLDFKWSRLNAIIAAIHPQISQLDVEIFRDADPKMVKALGGFMSIGVRLMPSKAMVHRQIQNMRADRGDIDVNPVSHALAVEAESGVVLSLRKEFVDYISQGDSALKTLCLYRWYTGWASYYMTAGRAKKKKGVTGAIRLYTKISQIPRYVTSATSIPKLQDVRKDCGYSVTDTQSDENGLTMMPNGMPAVLPKRDDIDMETVGKFESEFNAVLEELYSKGIPFSESHNTLRSDIFSAHENDLDIDRTTQEKANGLAKYRGICLGVDPDFATIVRSASQSIGIASSRTIGAKAPTSLDTADILGFDFAEPGESPNFRSSGEILNALFHSASETHGAANILFNDSGSLEAGSGKIISGATTKAITLMGESGSGTEELLKLVADISATYGYLSRHAKMPTLQQLVKSALDSLGYEEGSNLADSNYDRGIYAGIIENDLTVNGTMSVDRALFRLMVRTLNDAAGLRGSNLLATLINETGSISAAAEAMEEDPHYFRSGKEAKLADMGHLVNYLGGAVFREACNQILNMNRKKLYATLAESADAPNSNRLQHVTLPFATLYARCAPNALEIFSAAEDEVARLKPDTSITAENIQFPGLKSGTALMPHQLGAHQTLRRRPRYATIFIAPGGGKTIIGLMDIGCMMKELEDMGEEQIRPLILCPSNLVANWCDDLHKIADGWNAVPITSDTVKTWGEERLYDVITQAPLNTIFVAGLSFLSTGTLDVDIGGVRVRIRGAVEFVKRFNFSYVLLDESHKAKNMAGGSAVHLNTKAVFTVPSVRYARIATGTLVTDIVTDVVGQAALMSPTIFGNDLSTLDKGDGDLAAIRRAHSRLSNHTAFIAYKRKHWAFMLPSPIDTFYPVDIDDSNVPHSELHKQTYEAMYQQLFDMLNEAAEAAKSKRSDDDDDDGGNEENEGNPDFDSSEDEEGDVLGSLLANNVELNVYFQRMEQMLTDPMGDDIARETFEAAGVKNFTSAKVVTIIERIKQHFEVQAQRDAAVKTHQIFEWKPGVEPRELDIAVYEGKKYLARKLSEGYAREYLPPSMTPPPEDPDYWKEEKVGKLIVFTRYTRSANAIYNALPPNYKKIAVVFHGEVNKLGQDKVANLDAFKTDPSVQILIANEQAISEGHNMQMGSRIIRCDTPWSPGVYDQSTARIFRPDVSAAVLDENGKPGDMAREVVFIDWIMTNKTLEVGKVARLMWKTLQKTQFDEKGNELYEPLDKYDLQPIRMNAQLLIQNNEMGDFNDYFAAKAELNSIEQNEFAAMRKSTAAQMIPIEVTAPLRGFKVMDAAPIVANQKIPDRNGYGLERLRDWTKANEFVDGEILRRSLHMMPVVTEFGNGQIVGIQVRNEPGTNRLRVDDPISTVKVRIHGSDELIPIPATKIHLALKVTPKQLDEFFKTNKPWANETERKRAVRTANNKRAQDQIQDEKEAQDREATRERMPKIEREAARQKKRAENKATGKPINEGVKEAAGKVRAAKKPMPPLDNKVKPAVISPRAEKNKDDKSDMAFDLTPTVYNGFIALYADVTDPDTKMLKEQEFVEFGAYTYIDFFYYSDFESFLDYIEKKQKLEFDNLSAKRLEHVMDVFSATGRMSFNQKQAVKLSTELKLFFTVRHRAANDKKHLKVYPMVMEDRLRLMIDNATNPMTSKLVGKKIPNTRKYGTFEKADGMWIGFLNSVPKAKARINKIIKAGYTVTNLKKCVQALDKIKAMKDKSKA